MTSRTTASFVVLGDQISALLARTLTNTETRSTVHGSTSFTSIICIRRVKMTFLVLNFSLGTASVNSILNGSQLERRSTSVL